MATHAVEVATYASSRRIGDTARSQALAVVARASGRRRGEIGRIVAVFATLPHAVTVLQKYEAGTVGSGALVGLDAITGC